MTDFHAVKIRVPGPVGIEGTVELDGVTLKGVTDLVLRVGVDRVNELAVTLLVDSVDAEVMVDPEQVKETKLAPRNKAPVAENR